MEKEAMEGHVMVPLQSLSLELPDGEIIVGYNKDTSALQEEISTLRSRQRHLDRRRREVLDKLIDLKEDVFQEVKPILRSALDGHNVCILSYGQTGTGKTYTMEGTDGKLGIVPRAIQELFSHASEDSSSTYSFTIGMLEVYLGSLKDLLAPRQPL